MKKILFGLLLFFAAFSNAQTYVTQTEANSIAQSAASASKQQLLQATDYKIQAAGGFIAGPLAGKTLVTLGDSMTQMKKWQPTLVSLTGLLWDANATSPGNGVQPPMGVGGSQIVPEIRPNGSGGYTSGHAPGQSIFERAKSVKDLYPGKGPDIIILFGGQNDVPPTSYNINDEPYTGNEFTQGDGTVCSFVSAYKATLLTLMRDNPTAKIYAMTRMYNGVADTVPTAAQYTVAERINVIIRDICKRYSIEVIDLFSEIGFTNVNVSTFYQDSVHPNDIGGVRMGEFIAKKIR